MWTAGIYTMLVAILWTIPLFNVLHVESSAVIAGVSFFAVGLVSLKQLEGGRNFRELLATQLSILLVPWFLLTVSTIWQPNCSYGQGLLFYLLFVPPSVIFAVSLAFLVFASRLRWKKTCFVLAGLLIALGGVVFDLGFHAQFFTYNHVFGGVLGPIYDEELTVRAGLIAFRVRTLLLSVLCWSVAIRWQGRSKGMLDAVIYLSAGLFVVSYLFAATLRINTPAWFIRQTLRGHTQTEHFDIYYDDTRTDSLALSLLVDEHEYRYQFIRRQLGIDVAQRIQSYIYPDAETKDWLTGSRNTSVAPVWLAEPQMHILVDVFDFVFPHELGHVFSREFGLPIINASLSVGLIEGLAVSLEPADGRPSPHEQVLTAVALDTPPGHPIDIERSIGLAARLSPLGFWTGRGAVSYTTMGSFVRFLADEYGYDRVMRAYASGDFEPVFGRSIEELVAAWQNYLSALPQVDRSAYDYVTHRFSIPSLFEKSCPHYLPDYERRFRDGVASLAATDTLGAMRSFEEALDEEPAFEDALEAWAAIKISQGDAGDAIDRIQEILAAQDGIERRPTSAAIWVRWGDALAFVGEREAAVVAFDSAWARLPLYAHQQRGLVALRRALAGDQEVQRMMNVGNPVPVKVALLDSRMADPERPESLQNIERYIPLLQAILLIADKAYGPALEYLVRYQPASLAGNHVESIDLFAHILRAHLFYYAGRLPAALEQSRAIERYFDQMGAFNSARQYADFAGKIQYIMQAGEGARISASSRIQGLN